MAGAPDQGIKAGLCIVQQTQKFIVGRLQDRRFRLGAADYRCEMGINLSCKPAVPPE